MAKQNNGQPDRAVLVRESWARRVTDAVTITERATVTTGKRARVQYALSRFYDLRPALLQTAWSQNSAGVYQATAAFIVSDSGTADTSFIFPIYAIPGAGAPEGTAGQTRLFVVWRGRWEALPTGGGGGGDPVVYVAGNGIAIGDLDPTLGGKPITNTGVRSAEVTGSSGYIWSDGVFFIDGKYFKAWYSSTLGQYLLRPVTRRLQVVTGITNGTPTKEYIEVFDA